MSTIVELKLPSGNSVFAVAEDVSGRFREMSAGKSGERTLGTVADELRETLTVIAGAIENLTPRAPDKIGLEVSFEIGTNGVLKLLGADAKGGIKVSLAWENKPKT